MHVYVCVYTHYWQVRQSSDSAILLLDFHNIHNIDSGCHRQNNYHSDLILSTVNLRFSLKMTASGRSFHWKKKHNLFQGSNCTFPKPILIMRAHYRECELKKNTDTREFREQARCFIRAGSRQFDYSPEKPSKSACSTPGAENENSIDIYAENTLCICIGVCTEPDTQRVHPRSWKSIGFNRSPVILPTMKFVYSDVCIYSFIL